MYMRALLHAGGILLAAAACAVVFGAGVPLFWVWLASQVQTTTGPNSGLGMLSAAIVVLGPLGSFFALVFLVGRFTRGEGPVHRMAWMRSRDEVRKSARSTTSFEQVLILATFLVLIAFNIWFFFLARCPSTQCFGQ